MRVVEIDFLGKKYDLTFSNRVMMRIEQERLDIETLDGFARILSAMTDAGDRLARLEGREGKGVLSVDDLLDRMGPDDLMKFSAAMSEAQAGERSVETVDEPKNAGSTQPES